MTSEAPEMNFVRECTTTSAPQRAGDMIMGVNVLSTTSLTPCAQVPVSSGCTLQYDGMALYLMGMQSSLGKSGEWPYCRGIPYYGQSQQ